ncbi:2',3'-cyclic-nucleotide 3'-phosphodiesterase isoform X1 [Hippoglossus hippoglossus]|uniref:2',3'-cyclic-nucleotide 3'-phosphodiesterase isoform X1 n=1 Tax=Hippoglossus hippoglossus TaxID=8267 RepID=UPI00148DC8A9|nr:2',3'-cyclic-nucleotide 3'-phosphodiesterase isoform X1 [Hippoglossus hippoglossus]
MDTERSCEVLDASPQQEEVVMEKEAVSKLEAPEESTEPEKSPAAAEEIEQLAVNGHGTEVVNLKPTEELIVTEPVTLSEQKADGDSSPKDARDPESAPVVEASPEPDESSGKISDPVAALDAEPENVEPVPENDPEPVPVQATLAESVPVPEPVTKSEPEAELEEQTLPEPVALQEPVDAPPPPAAEEQNLPEQVETKAELQAMDAGAQMAKEGKAENNAVAEPLNEVQEDKPAVTEKAVEMVSVTEVASEKPTLKEEDSAVVGNEKSAEDKKEAEAEKSAEDKKEAEPEKSESDTLKEVAAALVAEVVESELNNAELVKEEDTVPASGSLSFALLEQGQTKDALRTSRTLIVLRGLPGSGKSFLARAIADAYKGHCSVICADDHGVKPENPESSAGGYKALDEAVVSCCSAGTSSSVLVVVDDTNHSQDRLARMGEIAEEHHLVAIFLEPQTAWSSDLAQLMTKSSRGLEEAQLDAMKGPLEEMSIPLFFGFFLLSSIQDKIRCTSMDFLKTLDTLEPFKTHMTDFTGKPDKEVDLEQYFKATGYLHCTTKYSNYGKAEGAKEYAQKPAVKDLYGSTFELALSALFVTPRTVGARVSLTEEQLLLWPDDAEKEAESSVPAAAALPLGSRAHITLGCAEGVEAVQTGLDLLDILALQQEGQKSELVVEMELGSLTYYGEGRWLLLLREPICALACFSSSYKRKELESTKKEPEKKKKMKCTIL